MSLKDFREPFDEADDCLIQAGKPDSWGHDEHRAILVMLGFMSVFNKESDPPDKDKKRALVFLGHIAKFGAMECQ